MTLRFRKPPRDHQSTEYWKYRDHKLRARTWSMRSGKSKSTLDEASYLFYTGKIDALVIVSPNIVHESWVLYQIPEHVSVPYRTFLYQPDKVARKYYQAEFTDFIFRQTISRHLKIFSIGSSAIATDAAKKFLATIAKRFKGRIMVVMDEVHEFSKVSSKRTRGARSIADIGEYRRIMTGTDTLESPMQAYSQYNMLAKGALGCNTLGEFEIKYGRYEKVATRGGRPYIKFLGTQNEEDLAARMAKYTSYVTRDQIKGLSSLEPDPKHFLITEKQRKVYDALIDNPVMDDEVVDGGVLMIKLQQITSGFLNFKIGGIKQIVPFDKNPRTILATQSIIETSGKILVWCHFTQEFADLRASLDAHNIGYMEAHGSIDGKKDHLRTIREFSASNSTKAILCHPRSVSMGLDMSFLGTVMWYSQGASNTSREQCSERATAVGKEKVDLIDIIAHNTIDTYIVNSRKRKLDVSNMIKNMSVVQFADELRMNS